MTLGLVCLLAWSAGIALAGVSGFLRPELGVLSLCLGGASAALACAVRPALYGLGLAFLLIGVGRVELAPAPAALDPAELVRLAGQQVTVRGVVSEDPKPQSQGYEAVVQPAADAGGRALTLHSRLLVQVRSQVEPAPGDEVEVSGRVALPRDRPGFDRRTELALKGIQFELRPAQLRLLKAAGGIRAAPLWLRERYRAAIAALLPPPHAQVLVGVVLGVRSGIPAQLQQDLVATGLVHLLVLSGLKVAIFARLARAALFPLLGRLAVVPVLVVIALYALAGGATPAALRATGMGALALVAAQVGRPTYVWTSLAAAAAGMLGWRPELIWDVGFQLSFAGTAAIILLTPG
nr:competence protein ComEC family protein [Candidatus Dormibacteraeota bacterium]